MAKAISEKKITRATAASLLTKSVGGNSIEYLEKEATGNSGSKPYQGRANLMTETCGIKQTVVVKKVGREFDYLLETTTSST